MNYFFGNKITLSNVTLVNTNRTNRDIKVLKVLILENLQSLRRFAYSLTNNVSDADDLVQDVVERLLKKSIPQEIKPLPWIFRVCKNAWIDEIRSRKVRTSDDSVDVEQIMATNNHQSEFEKGAQKQALLDAIETLPEAYKMVISLIVISGLSYAETSQTLGIPIGTVMSRVARAREKLVTKLGNTSEE